jgi:hypothetical protein
MDQEHRMRWEAYMDPALTSDLLDQLTHDRTQDLQATAAARRLVGSGPARRRIAQSLRRAADRLDAATAAAGPVGGALPGRG